MIDLLLIAPLCWSLSLSCEGPFWPKFWAGLTGAHVFVGIRSFLI